MGLNYACMRRRRVFRDENFVVLDFLNGCKYFIMNVELLDLQKGVKTAKRNVNIGFGSSIERKGIEGERIERRFF